MDNQNNSNGGVGGVNAPAPDTIHNDSNNTTNVAPSRYVGIDALGIKHKDFPVAIMMKHFPKDGMLGVISDDTFGDSNDNIKEALDTGKVRAIRAHLVNATVLNGAGRIVSSSTLKNYSGWDKINAEANSNGNIYKILKKELDKLKDLMSNYPNVEVYVSGLLEHQLGEISAKRIAEWLRNNIEDRWEVVNSPYNNDIQKGVLALSEGHGIRKFEGSRDIRSGDGVTNFNSDYYSKSYNMWETSKLALLYWWNELNFNRSGANAKEGEGFVPPRDRSRAPYEYQFEMALLSMTKPEPIPNVSGARMLTDDEIWKPASDTEKNNATRSGKGVLIVKSNASRLKITTLSGRQIGETGSGSSADAIENGTRYYVGVDSQSNISLWKKNGKKEWVIFTDGNTKWLINLFRRLGKVRKGE